MNATQLNLFDLEKAIEPSKSQVQYTDIKLSPQLLAVLKNIQVNQIETDWEIIIQEQLDRKLYEDFKKILKALRGHWDKKTHRFYYDPADKIKEIIDAGKFPVINPHAFFPTPCSATKAMIELSELEISSESTTILEPSAGDGSIVRELLRYSSNIHCCEIDSENVEILKSQGLNIVANDFLQHKFTEKYHWIFMNPPFATKGDSNHWLEHIKKAYFLLESGGKLAAILPPTFITSDQQSLKEFRNYVNYGLQWINLPKKTFLQSGTSVDTICICIQRFTEMESSQFYHSIKKLKSLPTLKQAQFEDLKIQENNIEIWLSRATIEDGEVYNNKVMVYKEGKKIGQYQAI